MIAYFAPGVRGDTAREVPAFARILHAGPWSCVSAQHPSLGSGRLAWNGGADVPDPIRTFADPSLWRTCKDGLVYRRPDPLPSQEALARTNIPQGVDVLMSTGVMLTIPLATAAPRLLDFSSPDPVGEPADDFGRLAFSVADRLRLPEEERANAITDGEILRLIGLAIMRTYRVTEELLSDLRWIATPDVGPILSAVMGSHPKASDPAGATSPSPAGASFTIPGSPQRK